MAGGTARGRRVAAAVAVAGALLTAGVPAASADGPAVATADGVRRAAPDGAAGRLTEARRASGRAAETGEPVEVTSARTEFTTTYANPDGGSFRLEQSSVPVRVKGTDGAWVPPDDTLERHADGSVGPRAAAVRIAFSGGGDGARLVTMTRDGRTLSLGWPGTLPAPVLDGPNATYPGVLPGVDLRMTATTEGFRQVLVVTTAAAAANPALRRIQYAVTSSGLKVEQTEDGGMSASDGNATEVFTSPPAAMWDSTGDAAAGQAGAAKRPAGRALAATTDATTEADAADGPAPGAGHAELPIQVGEDTLTLVPDVTLLQQQDQAAYPVYIDPSVTWGETDRTLLRSDGYTSYNWGNGSGNQGEGAGHCGTWQGYYCGPGYTQRLYFQFSPASLKGKRVLSATFRVTEPWAFQCSPRWVDLVRTNNVSSSTTWAGRPKELDWMVDRDVSAGRGSACDPDQPAAPIDFADNSAEPNENLTPTVQDFAAGKFSKLTLEVRAHDESDTSAWKRFRNDAVLVVDYVGVPAAATGIGLVTGSGTICETKETAPAVVSDPTPLLAAVPQTAPGGEPGAMLRAGMHIAKKSGTTWADAMAITEQPTTGHVGDNVKVTRSAPMLTEGVLYRYRAWTRSYYSNYTKFVSGPSNDTTVGWCYFKVDPTAPKAPVVTPGAPYTACTTTACAPAGGPGQGSAFTFAPAAGDAGNVSYQYRLSTSPAWSAPITGSTVKPVITPPASGTISLYVRARDNVGRDGATTVVDFLVAAGSGPVGRWHFDEDGGAAVDATGVAGHNATPSAGAVRDGRGRRGELPATGPDKGLSLNGTTGYAATPGPVLETRSAYTVAAWARIDKTTSHGIVLSQDGAGGYTPFNLYYDKDRVSYCFGVKEKDEANGKAYSGVCAKDNAAQVNAWTHLAGTYDPATQRLSLYLNGLLQGTTTAAGSWSATGPLEIGRYKWAGTFQYYFPGSIDEVAAWQRVLTPEEIAKEARSESAATGDNDVELVADWDPAGATGATLPDTLSGYGRPLTLADGASLDGESLALDGVDDAATTPGSVVDDTGSFTVTTKVELDRDKVLAMPIGSIGQVAGQRTADGTSWGIWFELTGKETRLDDDGDEISVPVGFWRFGRVAKDGTRTWVSSDEEASLDSPVRLTGVYDALAPTGTVVRLYVGHEQNDLDMVYTATPGSGEFAAGKGFGGTSWKYFLPARISDLRLWAGAMSDSDQMDAVIGD
ncbi:LamG domain-containing protein [Sphaerisporangium corydalis]|uniref:LamG-like jellyroll fold domain-containing protein n=1 Tax=Sphaerisporangium corydalis TaxID=1441875 RepID=A0ABV9ERC3_9ACTN|nr:LamG domain-containing protein [Sphaerisporangium corydalis]